MDFTIGKKLSLSLFLKKKNLQLNLYETNYFGNLKISTSTIILF